VNVPFTAAQTAGDLSVVVVGWNDSTATVTGVTDTSGNSYLRAVGPTIQAGVASQSIYYASNINSANAGANVVAVTFSGPARYPDIRVFEYRGVDAVNPVDVTAASSGSGTTGSSGSATTTNANDLLFGANLVQTTTSGPGSGFTSRLLTNPDGDIAEDRAVTATGSYSATAPLSSGQWIMQMVAFRAAGSVADTTPPSVTINQAAAQADPASASSINFTAVFSEAVTGFATGDVTVSGTAPGTKTATVTGSGPTFNIAVTGMTGSGTVIVTIGAGVATDLAGNPNNASTSTDNTVTYDNVAPSVTIDQAAGQADPVRTSPINFTVVFSEAVTGFATGDVTVSGTAPGTKTATVTGSGPTYNVAVTGMTGSGTVIAAIGSGKATDLAGNPNSASTSTDNTVNYDTVAPSVTINQAVGQADPTNTSPINFTVVFSEAVTGFATGDVTVSGTAPGTKTATVSGSGPTYNVAVTGMTGSGTVIATIGAGVATDLAGNPNTASTSTDNTVTFNFPTTPPTTVTINQDPAQADPANNSPINFTAVFSEAVTGFATGDVTVSGTAPGTKTATVTGSGATYNIAVTGMTGPGTVIATIAAGVATNSTGNPNSASTSTDNTVTYDNVAPSVTINQAVGQADPANNSPINFTVVFSEAVTGFATGDVTVSGTAPGTMTATVSGSGPTYNVAVTGMTGSGTVIATIGAGVATDLAGNPNNASTSSDNQVTFDNGTPSAPTGLIATVISGSQINLGWTASTDDVGVTGYQVERCQGAGCTNFGLVTTVSGTTFNDTGLATNSSFSYRIRATDAAGNLSSYSNVVTAVTPAPTVIAYVQGNYASPQSPQTTVNVPFTAVQTAGDLNVVVVGWNDSTATVTGVTDTRGNQYVRAVGPTIQAGVASQSIYYASNIFSATAGANLVTVTFSGPARYPDIRILEYRGADTVNPVDVTAASSGSGTTSSSGAAATTNANDLLFGANLVQTSTNGPGSGFTSRLLTNPDGDIAEDRAVTTTGSYSATAGISSGQWIMQMVAFRTATPNSDTIPPTAPSSLVATASGIQIDLAWTASTDNIRVTGYLVERCQGVSCSSFAQIATAPTEAYSDPGLTEGTVYSYRIRATDAAGNLSTYSNIASATTGIGINPRVTTLTFTQTQQFTASSSNVTWLVDGVTGGSTTSGTITTTGLYTPPSSVGTHTVRAVNQSQAIADATVYVVNYPGTFTRDIDKLRTGLNPNETVLTPANVNAAQFGKLYSYSIDGVSDASPLYVANLNIPGRGFHNVVFVATEHDSVYAFDADGLTPSPLWQVSFINPANSINVVPPTDTGECCDIAPEIGITGSPVIDQATNTLYVVVKTKEGSGSITYHHRLHALDITTGAEKFGGPVDIQASAPGRGAGSSGGRIAFQSLHENQRAALLLNNGVVYMAFGGHGDVSPYHGWILGYNASTLQQVMSFITSPNDNGIRVTGGGQGSGVWMSGDGLATDSSGNIFFVTGNGIFDANTGGLDYGDSLLKISPAGALLDYFTPHDQQNMNDQDIDLGSGGVLLLPDQPGLHPHIVITAGKNGTIYVVDRDAMGQYNPNNDNQIIQSVVNTFPNGTKNTGNFKAAVYWNGRLFFSADADTIKSFTLTNGQISAFPVSQSSFVLDYPGGTLGLSSNGTSNAILWVIQRVDLDPAGNGLRGPGSLHAFDAMNLSSELYNSNQASGSRDALDFTAKWSAPLVANGKVFISSNGRLTVFGLLP
jgi:hypothetical protein